MRNAKRGVENFFSCFRCLESRDETLEMAKKNNLNRAWNLSLKGFPQSTRDTLKRLRELASTPTMLYFGGEKKTGFGLVWNGRAWGWTRKAAERNATQDYAKIKILHSESSVPDFRALWCVRAFSFVSSLFKLFKVSIVSLFSVFPVFFTFMTYFRFFQKETTVANRMRHGSTMWSK